MKQARAARLDVALAKRWARETVRNILEVNKINANANANANPNADTTTNPNASAMPNTI